MPPENQNISPPRSPPSTLNLRMEVWDGLGGSERWDREGLKHPVCWQRICFLGRKETQWAQRGLHQWGLTQHLGLLCSSQSLLPGLGKIKNCPPPCFSPDALPGP